MAPPHGNLLAGEHHRHQGGVQQRQALRQPLRGLRGNRPQARRRRRVHGRMLGPERDYRDWPGRKIPRHQGKRKGLLREGPPVCRRVQPRRRAHHLQRDLPRRQGPRPLRQALQYHLHHPRQGIRHHHRGPRLQDSLVHGEPQRRGRDRPHPAQAPQGTQENAAGMGLRLARHQGTQFPRQPGHQERHRPHPAQIQGRHHPGRQGHLVRPRHPAPQRGGPRTASGQIHRAGQGAGHLCRRQLLHHLLRPGEQVPGRRGPHREMGPFPRIYRPVLGQRRQGLLRQALQLPREQQHPAALHLGGPRLQAGGHIGR